MAARGSARHRKNISSESFGTSPAGQRRCGSASRTPRHVCRASVLQNAFIRLGMAALKPGAKQLSVSRRARENRGSPGELMASPKKILVLDVGGQHVKMRLGKVRSIRKFDSGAALTAKKMVAEVKAATADWRYDAVSIGYPGVVRGGRPVIEPRNLGGGWVRFNYDKAFGKPVRMINDAAM